MLDIFLDLHANGRTKEPETITVICVTYGAYRTAILKGFHAIYLYDIVDFDDNDYHAIKYIQSYGYCILENADSISYSLVKELHEAMNPNTFFYVFYDSFIPRRYMPAADVIHLYGDTYEVPNITSDKNQMSVSLRHLLNGLRQKNNTIDSCLKKFSSTVNSEVITKFDLATYLDLSRPIITPHCTIIGDLNWKIRRYLGLINQQDQFLPNTNEWMVLERGGECVEMESGKSHILPVGYRFQVISSTTTGNGVYNLTFDYELPDGSKVRCITYASKRYIEYMAYGTSDEEHIPFSYCINFGYVIPHFYSVNSEYSEAIVLFDGQLESNKNDFYTCLLGIKNDARIYYNMTSRIEI